MKIFAANLKNFAVCLAFLICLFPSIIKAERPDVFWMRGGHTDTITNIDYSPNGQLLASIGDTYGIVKIWRISDGMLLRTLNVNSPNFISPAATVKFSSDSQSVAVSKFENNLLNVKVIRVSDGTVISSFNVARAESKINFLADGTIIVSTLDGLKFYHASSGTLLRTLTVITYVDGSGMTQTISISGAPLLFIANGRIALSTGFVIDNNGGLIGYTRALADEIRAISPDGNFIVIVLNGQAKIYRVADLCAISGNCNIPTVAPVIFATRYSFSPDGQTLAAVSASTTGVINFYRVSDWSLIRSLPTNTGSGLNASTFSPDSQMFASVSALAATNLSSVKFFRVSDGIQTGILSSHLGRVSSIAFSANGQVFASYSPGNSQQTSGFGEGTIRIWNKTDGTLIREIQTGQFFDFGIGNENQLMALSSDGQFVFSAGPNGSIKVWRISDGFLTRTISTSCRGLTISPDGQAIASINAGNGIDLYRIADGNLIRTIPLPSVMINGQPKNLSGTRSLAFTPDGQTLIAGELLADSTINPPIFKGYLSFFRFSDGGLIRTTETLSSDVRAVAVSFDGQSIASAGHGRCNSCTSNPTTGIAELRRVMDGSLIRSFTEHEGRDFAVAFTPNGQQIVTAGGEAAIRFWSVSDGTIAKLYDEELPNNPTTSINVGTLAFSPDGLLFAYGRQDSTLVMTRNTSSPIARRSMFDFDGDGKADQTVFRSGVWYLLQSNNGFTAAQFGSSTDKITPADFDGDGKTDIAVFRDGVWYWLNSSNGNFNAVQFGQAGDVPAPADYTGDGRAELAVYRGGFWYTLNLADNQFQGVQFGIASDKPVPADFDADGKTDFAVYRDGVWYLLRSTAGFTAVQFGIASDKPTVGDFDGDSKADQAVFRSGIWYILGSTQGFSGVQFGIASDVPVAADYDGDGKTDVAVFRDGIWYMLRSQQGFGAVQFGTTNDKPIPAAFVP